MSKNVGHLRLSRRCLLKTTGGLAGAAAIAGPLANVGVRNAGAQDEVTITIWGNHPEWKDPMQQILDAFQAATPGVKMELTEYPGQDYPTVLQTALAGQQPSDVLALREGDIVGKYGPAGEIPCVDLTGKLDTTQLIDSARIQVEYGGKSYGVPLASYTVGLAVQNKIVADNSVEPPKTWDDLKATCQKLLDADVTPLTIGAKDGVHPFFMYIGFASTILGPDGFQQLIHGERKLTDPDLLPAAQILVDLQKYYNEGFEATDYVTAKALFAQGQSAMMVAGTADFTGFKQENPDSDLSFIPWPGPQAGQYSTNTGFELLYTVSQYSSQEKQDAAAKFVIWLATPEAQTLVADTIALPVNKNVTELKDPIKAQTIAVRDKDVPVWYAIPETVQTFDYITQIQGGLWTGDLAPDKFAEQVQSVIVPTGSNGTPTA